MPHMNQRRSTTSLCSLAALSASLLACDVASTAFADLARPGSDDKPSASRSRKESEKDAPERKEPSGTDSAGRVRVSYPSTDNPKHAAVRDAYRELKLLERFADELNATIRLPRDLEIRLETCNKLNAWYSSDEPAIVFCYDLLEHAAQFHSSQPDAELRAASLDGFFSFVLLHEVGHALVNELKLPITGRQEDAVDQLATLLLIAADDEKATVGALTAAAYFAATGPTAAGSLPFWDEHSLGPQRFYDTACLVYGSQPDRNAVILSSGLLPQARAERCPREFAQVNEAWRTMLRPYLRDEKRFWD